MAGSSAFAALTVRWAMSAKADNKAIDYNAKSEYFHNNEIVSNSCNHSSGSGRV